MSLTETTAKVSTNHRINRFQDSDQARASRASFLTLNDAIGQIFQLLELDSKAADVANAIIRTEAENASAYRPFTRSNLTIGKKMRRIRSDDDRRIGKSAGQAMDYLFNTVQPNLRKSLFVRVMVDKNGQHYEADEKPDGYYKYEYTDHIVPAAQAALERAKNHHDYRRAEPIERQAILKAECAWAIETLLPTCTAEPRTKTTQKMDVEAYAQMIETRSAKELEERGDKLAFDYNDPGRAVSYWRQIAKLAIHKGRTYEKMEAAKWTEERITLPPVEVATVEPTPKPGDLFDQATFQTSDLGAFFTQASPLVPANMPEAEPVSNSTPREEGSVILYLGAKTKPQAENDANLSQVESEIDGVSEEREGANFAPSLANKPFENNNIIFTPSPELAHSKKWELVLKYVSKGWPVVVNHFVTETGVCSCPKGADCPPNTIGKHPAMSHGVNDATTDLGKLADYLRRKSYNVGIATGATSFDALDFDGEEGKKLFYDWIERGWITEGCLIARTPSGGFHVAIEHIPGLKNGVKPISGLDIRTTGGQIIVEGSQTPKGFYRWQCADAEPLKASPELRAYLLEIAGREQTLDSRPKPKAFPSSGGPIKTNGRKEPDYARCLASAPRKADGKTPDYSRADATYCAWALSHGFDENETARMLANVSDLSRKSKPDAYVARTVENAARRVMATA